MNIFEIESKKKKKTEEKSDSDVHEGLLHCLINDTSRSTVATYLFVKVGDCCNVNSV